MRVPERESVRPFPGPTLPCYNVNVQNLTPRNWQSSIYYLLLFVAALTLLVLFMPEGSGPEQVAITDFVAAARAGDIDRVSQKDNTLTGYSGDERKLTADYYGSTNDLIAILEAGGATVGEGGLALEVEATGHDWGLIFIQVFLPIGLLAALFIFFFRSARGAGSQAFNFGKSRARLNSPDRPQITFADVAGAEEAKEEVEEIVEFLKSPDKFRQLGGRIPRGVLLVGAPGTGKTLLAKAIAGEAQVPFYSISGSEFVEMFVGVGAARVRDLFEQAKRNSPCIIFVDEIDAVGRHRGAGVGGGHDEREQTLNQILTEMDGFDTNAKVIVVAATNRPDILDPALLRPGRFDRHIVIDLPDIKGRLAILKVHTKDKPLAEGIDLEVIAKQTPGFSGADLANLANEAALLAARRSLTQIGAKELEDAADRVMMGPERKSRVMSQREKLITAYHESGHALVARMLPNADPVHKITIIGHGMAGGFTRFLPSEDRHYVSRSQLNDQIAVALGGRAAEELQFGEITTGALQDLHQATTTARKMVTEYGMSDKLGPRTFGQKQELVFLGREISEQRDYSEQVARQIDEEVHSRIQRAYGTARKLLEDNLPRLQQLATLLVEKETLVEEEFNALFESPAPLPAAG
jgi:cell division protease FtsH